MAAAQKALEDQVASERQVTGKTLAECQQSNNLCMNRVGNLPNVVQTECAPYFAMCMSNAQAAQQAFAEQRAYEMQVTGKTLAQCQESNNLCMNRVGNLPNVVQTECAPYFAMCMANAPAVQQAVENQRAYEMEVTGKTLEQCQESNNLCMNRVGNLANVVQSECTPYFQACMNNAQAALAAGQAGAPPAPGQPQAPAPGGAQTASTCGLPGGTATVVIPDPAVTTLNVRDKPQGTILSTIPEGSQVSVVGGCGIQLSAGIVAQQSGGQPPVPGWCAITSPMIGCVSEQFLVAGIPAGGGVVVGAAGIVANQPQTAPPPPQPQANQSPPAAQVVVPGGQAGGPTARLTQGANIRNAASGGESAKTGQSLPGGTVVTVLEYVPNWCRIALPQFPVAWVSRGFLAFDASAPAPSADASVNTGGGTQPAPVQPPTAPGGGDGGTSICALPGGTATVVIPDPNVNDLNVRDRPMGNIVSKVAKGTQVNVVGGCGVQIAAGIVAQDPGAGGPPTPGWCAISAPVIGCVAQQFLVAGIVAGGAVQLPPAAGIVANQPQQQAAATFTGRWNAEAQGSPYTFNLTQTGDNVSGAYIGGDGSQGQITGTLNGNVLRFQWWQADGVRGMGKFTLSADGSAFTGSYTLGSDPDVAEGSWNGWRQ